MTTAREEDEFERIRTTAELERDRAIVARYEEHLAFYRRRIETQLYNLGRLDERLGGAGVTVDLSNDPRIKALRGAPVAEHEATIAGDQRWADEAGEAGDLERQRRYLAQVDQLKA